MPARKRDPDFRGARRCPACGASFSCGLAAGDAPTGEVCCWCFDLPPVMPVRADTACLCPVCLTGAIRQTQEVQ